MRKLVLAVSALMVLTSAIFSQDGNGRRAGVAVNPVFALFEVASAEVNLWTIDRHSEINIPLFFASNPYFIDDEDVDVNFFSTGVNYRYFFSESQQGFFAQAGLHLSRAGVEDGFGDSVSGSTRSILFGFGYRKIAKSGLFWGAGFSAGRTWGSIEAPSGEEISGSGLAFDIDLLKFGYAW